MEHLSLTRNQSLVFNILKQERTPLSAYTILDRLRDEGFRAPLQVYRALDKLIETGIVHRLESINAFIACAHDHQDCCSSHHHGLIAFAICDKCGKAREFHDHAIDHRLEHWLKAEKFKAQKTVMEVRGLCEECA